METSIVDARQDRSTILYRDIAIQSTAATAAAVGSDGAAPIV
jgi:hypothetical protein